MSMYDAVSGKPWSVQNSIKQPIICSYTFKLANLLVIMFYAPVLLRNYSITNIGDATDWPIDYLEEKTIRGWKKSLIIKNNKKIRTIVRFYFWLNLILSTNDKRNCLFLSTKQI